MSILQAISLVGPTLGNERIVGRMTAHLADLDVSFLYPVRTSFHAYSLTLFSLDFSVGSVQRKKIYIPVREHPDINFLGTRL